MHPQEIRVRRQHNQLLVNSTETDPAAVVAHMAAMQAQEYAMAKWAIALRMENGTDEVVEKAFNDGRILRTHTMRPTWHFIANEDIRWMLDITAPRVIAVNAFMYRKLGLDDTVFAKSFRVLEKILEGNNYLTRDAIKQELAAQKIGGDGMRIAHIMMQAELTGLVCSGPRDGNQFTYALIDERAPKAKKLSAEESLRELCSRYFGSRGPATLKDFTTWSGLTVKQAKEGIALIEEDLKKTVADGTDYYFTGDAPKSRKKLNYLMPDYDEYGMAYKDRSVLIDPASGGNKSHFDRVVIIDGMTGGTWRRTIKKEAVELELQLFQPHKVTDAAVKQAVADYAAFLGKKVRIM